MVRGATPDGKRRGLLYGRVPSSNISRRHRTTAKKSKRWIDLFVTFDNIKGMKMVTEKDARNNISENLRRMLQDRGMRQSDLARMAGEPDIAISRLVRGLHNPSVTLLSHVAEALDVSMERLISPPPKKIFPKSA